MRQVKYDSCSRTLVRHLLQLFWFWLELFSSGSLLLSQLGELVQTDPSLSAVFRRNKCEHTIVDFYNCLVVLFQHGESSRDFTDHHKFFFNCLLDLCNWCQLKVLKPLLVNDTPFIPVPPWIPFPLFYEVVEILESLVPKDFELLQFLFKLTIWLRVQSLRLIYEIFHHSDLDTVTDHIVIESPLTQEVSSVDRLSDLFLHSFDLFAALFGCLIGFDFLIYFSRKCLLLEVEHFSFECVLIPEF